MFGVAAWSTTSSGKSWNDCESVRIRGQAYQTDKRLVTLDSKQVKGTIPLSGPASANVSARYLLVQTEVPLVFRGPAELSA